MKKSELRKGKIECLLWVCNGLGLHVMSSSPYRSPHEGDWNPFPGSHPSSFLQWHTPSLCLDPLPAQHVVTLASKNPPKTFTSNMPSCCSFPLAYSDGRWLESNKWMGFWRGKTEQLADQGQEGTQTPVTFRRLELDLKIFLPSSFFPRENTLGMVSNDFILFENKEYSMFMQCPTWKTLAAKEWDIVYGSISLSNSPGVSLTHFWPRGRSQC